MKQWRYDVTVCGCQLSCWWPALLMACSADGLLCWWPAPLMTCLAVTSCSADGLPGWWPALLMACPADGLPCWCRLPSGCQEDPMTAHVKFDVPKLVNVFLFGFTFIIMISLILLLFDLKDLNNYCCTDYDIKDLSFCYFLIHRILIFYPWVWFLYQLVYMSHDRHWSPS